VSLWDCQDAPRNILSFPASLAPACVLPFFSALRIACKKSYWCVKQMIETHEHRGDFKRVVTDLAVFVNSGNGKTIFACRSFSPK
jgi:hypothetical protein